MPIIEVQDLVKKYGERSAVDGVSFTVEDGEIFGILGPNGAGKTSTVESIAGLRTPDSGTINVLGLDPRLELGIGAYTPPGVQALQDTWMGSSLQLPQLATMAAITVVAGVTAARAFRWE